MLRFSVVVPTFQRKDVVQESVRALDRQRFDGEWEIIVVVDGSTDGTAAALRELDIATPLTIVEQPNRGLSAARNRGAAEAKGELVLFLDDDMEADPEMLAEHDRTHRDGADAVMGHMPLHPDSPPTLISRAVEQWADERIARLEGSDAPLPYRDLLGGQLSVRRDVLESLTGFDQDFTAGGAFGGEDLDFGYRLVRSGRRVVFNPKAVSWQKYVVKPASHLRQWRDAGRASVALVRKHPEARADLQAMLPGQSGWKKWVWRPLLSIPLLGPALLGAVRTVALLAIRDGNGGGERSRKLFFAVRDAERLRGTIEAGGVPRGPTVCVLAYHAVEDLRDDPVLGPYGVPADVFERQLDTVAAAGYRFVGLTEALDALRGGAPEDERLALVTFDDCYTSVLHAGVPVLRSRGIPAVAFAVSGHVGGTNAWDRSTDAGELDLLDADGLRRLAEAEVEIGAHSRSHRPLAGLEPDEIETEVRGSMDDIEGLGLPRPRAIAYPHGEQDDRVREAAAAAGLEAGFTTQLGLATPASKLLALPRVEVTPLEVGARLRMKLMAARAPAPVSRRVARWSLRSAVSSRP